MKTIAELTADDSSAMKQLSFIALILLPVTVVSVSQTIGEVCEEEKQERNSDAQIGCSDQYVCEQTVLSTDIVKFQDLSNENESGARDVPEGPVPIYHFSAAAFGTWAVASVVMTIVTLAIVKPIGGGRVRRAGGGAGGDNPKEKVWASLAKRRISYPWNARDARDAAENERPPPGRMRLNPEHTAASSIHTAPTVAKAASNSPNSPVVGVGAPTHAGVVHSLTLTLTSTGRWLGAAWGTLWRTAKNKVGKMAAVATPLPR